LGELVAERVRRPRDRERAALDLLDGIDVVEGHVIDDDGCDGDHDYLSTPSASGGRARRRRTGPARTAARSSRPPRAGGRRSARARRAAPACAPRARDRKSTRLNSSHVKISYAVFCFKKKTV